MTFIEFFFKKIRALIVFPIFYFLSVIWLLLHYLRLRFGKYEKMPIPVVCVGNITLGGAGKTPPVLFLVSYLKKNNINELKILIPVVKLLKKTFPNITLSIDTFWSETANKCVALGADMINDISAGNIDSNMLATIAKINKPYVLMHMQGTPQTMQIKPKYENYSTLFHSKAEVEGLYQNLSEFASMNGLIISVIEKGQPVQVSKSKALKFIIPSPDPRNSPPKFQNKNLQIDFYIRKRNYF